MKEPVMIGSPSFPDFVIKKENSGTWRKYLRNYPNSDFTIETDMVFEDYKDAFEYLQYLNAKVGRSRFNRLSDL